MSGKSIRELLAVRDGEILRNTYGFANPNYYNPIVRYFMAIKNATLVKKLSDGHNYFTLEELIQVVEPMNRASSDLWLIQHRYQIILMVCANLIRVQYNNNPAQHPAEYGFEVSKTALKWLNGMPKSRQRLKVKDLLMSQCFIAMIDPDYEPQYKKQFNSHGYYVGPRVF